MSQKTCIVGIGGAGSRIISNMKASPLVEASIVALDTDSKSLYEAVASTKVQLAEARVHGESTAGDANLGRLAAEDDVDMIRTLFAGNTLAFVVLGLGGGAATGAAPIVLRAAQDAGALTICFATLPFDFEADHRRSITERGIAALRENSDALVLIPNQELFTLLGEGSVNSLFAKADELLGDAISGIWRVIAERGHYNPNFADVQAMLKHCGGACHLGYASTSGSKRVEQALDALGQGGLLNHGRTLGEARVALISVMGGDADMGPEALGFKEVTRVRDGIATMVPEECRILLGTVIDEAWKDRLAVSVLMSEEWVETREKPPPAVAPTPASTAKGRHVQQQALALDAQLGLPLDEPRRSGRFQGAEPTIVDGKDLDIPTYQRRHIAIER